MPRNEHFIRFVAAAMREGMRQAEATGGRMPDGARGFLAGLEERGSGMRDLHTLDDIRERGPAVIALYGDEGDATCGRFRLPSPVDGRRLTIVASAGYGWDHVSVSRPDRCPTWDEMEAVKRMFFHPTETAMQLHVPEVQHISRHPHCLHLWRPHLYLGVIPRPPSWMVG